MKVEILILAAGTSSRMKGRNKLLEPIRSLTLLEKVIIEAINSKANAVSVILPSETSPLWNISGNYPVHRLSVYTTQIGMGYSISCGIISIKSRNPDGVIIVLADMPEIKTIHLDKIIHVFTKNQEKGIVRPTSFDGKPGNPVLFSWKFFDHLINLKGDKGAKKIISENQKDVQYIELPGDVSLVDLDTREQWDAWKKNL